VTHFQNYEYILLKFYKMISIFSLFLCSLIYVIQFDLYFMMIIKMKDIINNTVILKWKHLLCTKYNNYVAIAE